MNRIASLVLSLIIGLSLHAQTKEELLQRAIDNPNETSSIALIQKAGGYDPDYKELRTTFKKLNKKVRKSTQGKVFDRYLKALENASVGKRAPGITQFDLEGMPYSLSDLKGKYVLVDFWASWNPISRQNKSELVTLHEQFKDDNFDILGVSFDTEFDAWQNAIEEDKLAWKHVSDLQGMNNYAGQIYGIKVIPQNILVDPEGVIIARNLQGEDLKNKLTELLTR